MSQAATIRYCYIQKARNSNRGLCIFHLLKPYFHCRLTGTYLLNGFCYSAVTSWFSPFPKVYSI